MCWFGAEIVEHYSRYLKIARIQTLIDQCFGLRVFCKTWTKLSYRDLEICVFVCLLLLDRLWISHKESVRVQDSTCLKVYCFKNRLCLLSWGHLDA